MPVLEVTQLRLKGVSAMDPALLKTLSSAREALKTNSQFYHCIENPSLIYILGLWPSLNAHTEFLASPRKEEILGPQEDQLEFQWAVHMELDAMSSLPLDAPVMAITRLLIKENGVDALSQEVHANHRKAIIEGTRPYKVADGWRCDPAPGKHEALMLTGWPNAEAHAAFTAKAKEDAEYAGVRKYYEGMEVSHARNMEGTGP
ncbi:uncharacterized protein BDR25DRAFT_305875 [Lindgomyces ingoldianus]|uniref:Uncharacterized protein n=1 Tax=Lindgomyces ingoldianus TaxID=673940 RepID=A0ACB6QKJ1_9PLEO|nr:uncharacterized protein BDR25DRAFT_305875 [Lindgomyces ingoldianus]KAF2467093.1 hypothetical protein BDR25DRAFT_305875 [Lindgomyces ingoldianus]